MANGTIAFDTLSTSGQISGIAVSLDTDYLAYGSAKAWANTSGVGTPALADSFNVTTVADRGTGVETFTFTNAMGNINFSTCALSDHNSEGVTVQIVPDFANTTTTSTLSSVNVGGTARDTDKSILIHGDLA